MVLGRLFGWGARDDREIGAAEAKRRQDDGARLIDVREPSEWAAGRAAGAVHIPLGKLQTRLSDLPKDRDLIFICHAGNRSLAAVRLARAGGFDRSFSVSGGTSAWARAGLPIKK
jgi:rhodanese-related sulfurtransferase